MSASGGRKTSFGPVLSEDFFSNNSLMAFSSTSSHSVFSCLVLEKEDWVVHQKREQLTISNFPRKTD